jgi:hypothetical protein
MRTPHLKFEVSNLALDWGKGCVPAAIDPSPGLVTLRLFPGEATPGTHEALLWVHPGGTKVGSVDLFCNLLKNIPRVPPSEFKVKM